MTTNSNIRKSISISFEQKDYPSVFSYLLVLPPHEVVKLLSKNEWSKNEHLADYFSRIFAIEKHEEVFNSAHAETLLNWYFKNDSKTSDALDALLAEFYPKYFLRAIKRNRAFLNRKYLDRLMNYKWPQHYSIHLLAWDQLNKRHNALQSKISRNWNGIKSHKLEELLCQLIAWIDRKFYLEDSNTSRERLRLIYNYAMSIILNDKQVENVLSEKEFDLVFFETTKSSRIEPFLKRINEWIEFESTILSSYCYDDNFRVSLKDGIIHFDFHSDKAQAKWEDDTKRYLVNAKRYLSEAREVYKVLKEEGKLEVPTGKTEIDTNINHLAYIVGWQSVLFLDDLQIRNFWLNKRSVHSSKFVSGLISYAVNRQTRYIGTMRSFIRYTKTWAQGLFLSIGKSLVDEITNTPLPYMYISKEDFSKMYDYALPELQDEEIEGLIHHFSWEIQQGKTFDPFNVRYSISENPFIRIGDHLLTSTSLFAVNDWFYSFGQRALNLYSANSHSRERQQTADEMELFLGNELLKKGWKVKVTTKNESNLINGDIDVFVDDGKTQILIQLKRTKFKLDLASIYKEKMEIDLIGAGQLNDAVEYLTKTKLPEMSIFKSHEKWIVTTSFEGVLSEINGCLKVNYFDLLWALKYQKHTSLKELKVYIESDGPFEDCRFYLDLEF